MTKWTNLGGQKSEKVDFEKVFPPFHAFSTKTVPDFCGFQYLRISLSPKNQRISGTPCTNFPFQQNMADFINKQFSFYAKSQNSYFLTMLKVEIGRILPKRKNGVPNFLYVVK